MNFAIETSLTRRKLVGACTSAIAALMLPRAARGEAAPVHPAPRPGITGKNVLTEEQLAGSPRLIPLFDSVREMPEIMDGIGCDCGCTDPPELRSLLSCFEGKGMARNCYACQRRARSVIRLHKEGKSLDQIRAALDD